jgi:glycosyltransferase involved in cell wall biosynthesis
MGKERNVLQFMSYNAPYKGSFFNSLLRLETRVNQEGIGMVYLFQKKETFDREWVKELIAEGKTIYFLSGNYVEDLLLVSRILRRHKIRIIHTHFAGVKQHLLFNIMRQTIKGKIFLINHLHNHYDKKPLIKRSIIKWVSNIDLYVGCSRSVAVHHRSINNIEESKITFVENGVDFSRLDNYSNLDKKAFSIKCSTKAFLMFGFDYYRKGVDLALEAISEINDEGGDVCLLLSLSSNKEFALSKIRARFNGIPDWIKFLEPRNDIATYYHLCDAFLSPSRSEGFCYSLVEAAYCGIPLIASKIPHQDYLYIPTMFQFKSEDVSELKGQILMVLSLQDEKRKEIGKEEKDFVLKSFNLDKWTDEIFSIYQSFNKSFLQSSAS